jgi:hypothetical protein
MDAEQSSTWLCPAIELHEVGEDGEKRLPEVIFAREAIATLGRTNAPDLVIVSGPLHHPVALAQAIQISGRQNERTLLVAVLHIEEGLPSPTGAELGRVYGAFDAVFVVDGAKSEQLVRRLVRALITTGGPDQLIGCDWNDACSIVKGSNYARPARYGFGCSLGERRSTDATASALAQIVSQGADLHDVRGLCVTVTAAKSGLYGREIKEVMRQILAKINSAVNVVQSIGYDSALNDGQMEVDIFAFGEYGGAALAMENQMNNPAVAGHGTKPILGWQFSDPDPLYHRARSIILNDQRASISLVQRHLRIGYQRASRLLDAMEGDILSMKDEDGVRTVIVT